MCDRRQRRTRLDRITRASLAASRNAWRLDAPKRGCARRAALVRLSATRMNSAAKRRGSPVRARTGPDRSSRPALSAASRRCPMGERRSARLSGPTSRETARGGRTGRNPDARSPRASADNPPPRRLASIASPARATSPSRSKLRFARAAASVFARSLNTVRRLVLGCESLTGRTFAPARVETGFGQSLRHRPAGAERVGDGQSFPSVRS